MQAAGGQSQLVQGAWALRPAALTYRFIALVLALLGVIRISGIFTGAPTWSAFLFFTVLSNILCVVWLAILVMRTSMDLGLKGVRGLSSPSARWSGAVMFAITVTMLVYLFVLLPAAFQQAGDYEPFSLTDTLLHVLTPCLLIIDWLLFIPKGAFRRSEPLIWAIIPLTYLVFAYALSALGVEFGAGQKYPYPFMNVELHGVGGVAAWIVGLTVALLLVGYLYVLLDGWLARKFPGRMPNAAAA